jgi:hypothetical protein
MLRYTIHTLYTLLAAVMLCGCNADDIFQSLGYHNGTIAFDCELRSQARSDSDSELLTTFTVFGYGRNPSATNWYTVFDKEKFTLNTTEIEVDDEDNDSSASGPQEDNVRIEYSWTCNDIQYWANGNYYTFHAISPAADESKWSFTPDGEDITKGSLTYSIPEDASEDLTYAFNNLNGSTAQRVNGEYDTVTLNFDHLLSRVRVSFYGDDDIENSLFPLDAVYYIVTNVKISGINKSGKLEIDNSNWSDMAWTDYTDGGTYSDMELGDVKHDKSDNQLLLLNEYDEEGYYFKDGEYGTAGTLFVIPSEKDDQAYTVTFDLIAIESYNSSTHIDVKKTSCTATLPQVDMKIGYSYDFSININSYDLGNAYCSLDNVTVVEKEIDDSGSWSQVVKDESAAEGDITLSDSSDYNKIQQYDLLMADGTFYSMHDDEGKLLTSFKNCSLDLNNVRGIVYYVGTVSGDKLPSTYSHGLIVALNDAASGGVQWSDNTTENVYTWQANNSTYKSYTSILRKTENINKLLGYSNTLVIRGYNSATTNGPTSSSNSNSSNTNYTKKYTVNAVELIDSYESANAVAANTSGWFLGSAKEMVTLCCGYTTISSSDFEGTGATTVRDGVNKIIGMLKSIGVSATELSNYYWTSNEREDGYATAIDFRDSKAGTIGKDKKTNTEYVRAICAF